MDAYISVAISFVTLIEAKHQGTYK